MLPMDHGQSSQSSQDESKDAYFEGYGDLDVHELMLKDRPRTLAYKQFIEENASLFSDKIVIDVGSGTGILSLFAAKAGARHVYAIEASGIAQLCQEIVAQNGLADRITVLQSRVEDVELPDGVKADVLISEWMGFYLLHESMLESVLHARDKLLKPEGVMVPSSASLYLAPVAMHKFHNDKFQFWHDVYGFDYTPALTHVRQKYLSEPQILTLDPDQCLADPELVTCLELRYVESEDLAKLSGRFNFKMKRNGVLHGFACWFDVDFEGDRCNTLSTGPSSSETHWKQTCIVLPETLLVSKGEEVACRLNLIRSGNNARRYDICIEVEDEVSDDEEQEEEDNNSDDASETRSDQNSDSVQTLIKTAMEKTLQS